MNTHKLLKKKLLQFCDTCGQSLRKVLRIAAYAKEIEESRIRQMNMQLAAKSNVHKFETPS